MDSNEDDMCQTKNERISKIKSEPMHDIDEYGNINTYKTVGVVKIKSEPTGVFDQNEGHENVGRRSRRNTYDKEIQKLERSHFDDEYDDDANIENVKSETKSEEGSVLKLSVDQMISSAVNTAIQTPRKRKQAKETTPKPRKPKLDIVENALKDDDGKIICPFCTDGTKRCTDKRGLERHLLSAHWDKIKDQLPPNITKPNTTKSPKTPVTEEDAELDKMSAVDRNGDGKFPCCKCEQTFTLKPSLRRHLKNVHLKGWKVVECAECGKGFRSQLELERHSNIHKGEKPFKCDHCDVSFAHPANLRKHVRAYHSEEDKAKFTCDICGKVFSRVKGRNDHRLTHLGAKPHRCPQCDKCFTRKAELNVHMVSVHSGKRIPCPQCDKTFAHSRYLALHIRGFHNLENKNVCKFCNKNFLYPYKLAAHVCPMATAPSPPRPFLCDLCGKTYLCRGDLMTHKISHSEDKKHQCKYCGKRFKHCHQMTKHISIHTRENPLCGQCGLSFTSLNKLTRHERKVHGITKKNGGTTKTNQHDTSVGDVSENEDDESISENEADITETGITSGEGFPLAVTKLNNSDGDATGVDGPETAAEMTSSYINSLLPTITRHETVEQSLTQNTGESLVNLEKQKGDALNAYSLLTKDNRKDNRYQDYTPHNHNPLEPGEVRPYAQKPISITAISSVSSEIMDHSGQHPVSSTQLATSQNNQQFLLGDRSHNVYPSIEQQHKMQALASTMYADRAVREFLSSQDSEQGEGYTNAYTSLNQSAYTKDATTEAAYSQATTNVNPPVFPDLL